MTSLPRTFFDRDAREVAIDLLGRHLVRTSGAVDPHPRAVATIVETAAYLSSHDLACRACQGRIPRTAMMVGARGHANVFPICDMYHCLDAVTGRDGTTGAVLIRTVFVGHDEPPRQGGRCRGAWPGRLTPAIEVTPAPLESAIRHHQCSFQPALVQLPGRTGTNQLVAVHGPRFTLLSQAGTPKLFTTGPAVIASYRQPT